MPSGDHAVLRKPTLVSQLDVLVYARWWEANAVKSCEYLFLKYSNPNSLLCHPSRYVYRLLESRHLVVVNQTRSFDNRLIRVSRRFGNG
jgi:hypothetical protein